MWKEARKTAIGKSQEEQQVSRQYCKLYRFNLKVLVATKGQFWPNLSAALWDHQTAGKTTCLLPSNP